MEILIVVVILGIMAAIVVPQFTNAGDESRLNSLSMDLHRIRIQIEIYRIQHTRYPELARFTEQMTQPTNADGVNGALGDPAFPFGPYLREVPANPFTGTRVVGDGVVGSSDWFYDQATGEFRANDSAEHRAL